MFPLRDYQTDSLNLIYEYKFNALKKAGHARNIKLAAPDDCVDI